MCHENQMTSKTKKNAHKILRRFLFLSFYAYHTLVCVRILELNGDLEHENAYTRFT